MSEDFIKISLKGIDNFGDLWIIIFVNIQDIFDIKFYQDVGIYGIVFCICFVSEIAKVNKESGECFSDCRKNSQNHKVRIIFFEKDSIVIYGSKKFFADPKIQIIDILFYMIDILFSKSVLEYRNKCLIF